jgi:hypothetical protein
MSLVLEVLFWTHNNQQHTFAQVPSKKPSETVFGVATVPNYFEKKTSWRL